MTDHIGDANKMPSETRRERRRRRTKYALEAIKDVAVDVFVSLVTGLIKDRNRKD
jgi:hypothetical protein